MPSTKLRHAPHVAVLSLSLFAAACASGLDSSDYSRGSVGNVSRTTSGTVLQVREVRIEGTKSGIGTGAGAVIGGAAGASIGDGRAADVIGGAVGAVVGGIAGAAAEEGVTRQKGHEYTIRRSDGSVITIVQGADANMLPPGPIGITC
ncbi:MAG: hypothetical protein AAGF19_10345 [Pseudomonadota bacterium]